MRAGFSGQPQVQACVRDAGQMDGLRCPEPAGTCGTEKKYEEPARPACRSRFFCDRLRRLHAICGICFMMGTVDQADRKGKQSRPKGRKRPAAPPGPGPPDMQTA